MNAGRNPAGAVYGTVLAGSLPAVDGGSDDVDISHVVLVVLATQVVYWLAHVYSELVGRRVSEGRRLGRADVGHLMGEEWSMVAASFGPLAVVVAFRAFGADPDDAILAGLYSCAVLLAAWAFVAGRSARLRYGELLLYTVVSAAFGLTLVLLKTLLH